MSKKTVKRNLLLIFLLYTIYMIIGVVGPFVRQKQIDSTDEAFISVEDFYSDTYGGDRAAIIESNQEALNIRLNMFEAAEEKIIISTFDIREGNSTTDIFSSLISAADRGISVQILVDGLYGIIHMNGSSLFAAAGSHPNIEIRFYNTPDLLKPWTFNGRLHDKYVIIDDKLLLVGGRNMFDYFIGEYPDTTSGYDREVLIYNTYARTDRSSESVIAEVCNYFIDVWGLDTCNPVFTKAKQDSAKVIQEAQSHYAAQKQLTPWQYNQEYDYYAITLPIKKATLIHNSSNITSKEPYVWYYMNKLMQNAEKRVFIQSPYAVLSEAMYQDLTNLSQTLEDVKLMINSVEVGDNFMASSDYLYNKSKVVATGVQLYEYFGVRSEHAKSVLIDHDISIIGSYNLDMRSTYVDTETMLVIHGEEFNELLEKYINENQVNSLLVNNDGSYVKKENVQIVQLSGRKKFIFSITSRLIQLVRFLV